MWDMILLAWSLPPNLFLKYSSFCGSVNPLTSITMSTHLGGIRLAAAGHVVIQRRAEGSSFPQWVLTEAHPLRWALWRQSGSHCCGSPEEVDTPPDRLRWTQPRSLQSGRFLLLWLQERSNESVQLSCTFSPSAHSALRKWMEMWTVCPGWICLQPSPEWTSVLRLFSQFQLLPLSWLFWLVHLFQLRV